MHISQTESHGEPIANCIRSLIISEIYPCMFLKGTQTHTFDDISGAQK